MSANLNISRFQPVRLTVENIGPFRAPFELSFTDKNGDLCNFFMLVSRNGFGKTTALETIWALMFLLAPSSRGDADFADNFIRPELRSGRGRAQLDVRIQLGIGTRSRVIVASFCAGTDEPLRAWVPSVLSEAQADEWVPFVANRDWQSGYRPFGDGARDLGLEILSLFDQSVANKLVPSDLFGSGLAMPTALLFPADRGLVVAAEDQRSISRPAAFRYRPAHHFGVDGRSWPSSIDGLLVWLEWLDPDFFMRARELINELLFEKSEKKLVSIDRNALAALIDTKNGVHRIDRLSHGEKAMLQLILRAACHMTESTILLIDELETHLHPKWQHALLRLLKKWVQENTNLTVIATTHQPDVIEAFSVEKKESGLVKGGYIIDANEL